MYMYMYNTYRVFIFFLDSFGAVSASEILLLIFSSFLSFISFRLNKRLPLVNLELPLSCTFSICFVFLCFFLFYYFSYFSFYYYDMFITANSTPQPPHTACSLPPHSLETRHTARKHADSSTRRSARGERPVRPARRPGRV